MGGAIFAAMMAHDIAMIEADPHHAAAVLGIRAAVMIPLTVLMLWLLWKPAPAQ